jgi:hypothetical protein
MLLATEGDPSSVLPPPIANDRQPIFKVPEGVPDSAIDDCTVWKAEKSNIPDERIPTHRFASSYR